MREFGFDSKTAKIHDKMWINIMLRKTLSSRI